MGPTEVLIEEERISISLKNTLLYVYTWEEFDELEVAFDVVRRLTGGIKEKRLSVSINEEKK